MLEPPINPQWPAEMKSCLECKVHHRPPWSVASLQIGLANLKFLQDEGKHQVWTATFIKITHVRGSCARSSPFASAHKESGRLVAEMQLDLNQIPCKSRLPPSIVILSSSFKSVLKLVQIICPT